MSISVKYKILFWVCLFVAIFFSACAYAELSEAEKEVVWFVEMCEQQASVGEHTDGMSGGTMDMFVSLCEVEIAKAYHISRDDIKYLILNKRIRAPFPSEYKKPEMISDEEKRKLNDEIKKLMEHSQAADKAEKQSAELRKKYGVE